MPQRAFVPAPLIEANPRVYRSLRGRQLHGILMGLTGAGVSVSLLGAGDLIGYASAFLAALPGFAYGYFQPEGKPVEHWLLVLFRYHLSSRIIAASPPVPWHRELRSAAGLRVRAAWYLFLRRLSRPQGRVRSDG